MAVHVGLAALEAESRIEAVGGFATRAGRQVDGSRTALGGELQRPEVERLAHTGAAGRPIHDDVLDSADTRRGAECSIMTGVLTASSLGGIGGTAFTPIINAPEVAILGVSRTQMKPVWDGKEFKPRQMLPLSLSYDHRLIDGAMGARFAVYLSKVLSEPATVLAGVS